MNFSFSAFSENKILYVRDKQFLLYKTASTLNLNTSAYFDLEQLTSQAHKQTDQARKTTCTYPAIQSMPQSFNRLPACYLPIQSIQTTYLTYLVINLLRVGYLCRYFQIIYIKLLSPSAKIIN